MKIAIIQEASRHIESVNFRECKSMENAFKSLGHEVFCVGVGHKLYEPIDCDVGIVLEQYDQNGWTIPFVKRCEKKVFWSIDTHCNFDNHLLLKEKYKPDITYTSVFSKRESFVSGWLPNAYDDTIIKPGGDKDINLGYCGSFGPDHRTVFLRSIGNALKLTLHINHIGYDMVRSLQRFKISLNRNILDDINYRTFESCGAGCLCLTNYTPGLERLFDIGKEILIYKNSNDCIEKIKKLLDDKVMLSQIAESGYQRVKSEHTYLNRAKKILEDLCRL